MKTVSEESASAAELETPHSMDEAMETGFLPDDEHYRLTGEFKPEKTDASAAATKKENESEKADASAASGDEKDESENDDASAASSSKAAASETAQSQNQGRKENRWQKRERELRELKAENARLKSQSSQPQPRSETQQSSTTQTANETKTAKAAPKPKIDDVDAAGKPKYKNFAEYEDAKDDWLRKETLREFSETQAKSQQLTEQQTREREIGQSLTKKFEPVRAKYADFDKFALNDIDLQTGKPKYSDAPVLTIPKGSAAETFFMDSENAGEVLYYLGHHPEILNDCYSVNKTTGAVTSLVPPARVFRKLMEIETSLTGSGSGAGANGESSTSSSSAKPVTQASRPPHQVSGKGTVAKDAVEQALDDGDFETYQRTQNAKELARLKKK